MQPCTFLLDTPRKSHHWAPHSPHYKCSPSKRIPPQEHLRSLDTLQTCKLIDRMLGYCKAIQLLQYSQDCIHPHPICCHRRTSRHERALSLRTLKSRLHKMVANTRVLGNNHWHGGHAEIGVCVRRSSLRDLSLKTKKSNPDPNKSQKLQKSIDKGKARSQ